MNKYVSLYYKSVLLSIIEKIGGFFLITTHIRKYYFCILSKFSKKVSTRIIRSCNVITKDKPFYFQPSIDWIIR